MPRSPPSPRLVNLVRLSVRQLMHIKGRLPVLGAIAREVGQVAASASVRNDIFQRFFRDSFDMLVIDLCSLREKATTKGGLFKGLRQVRLRRFRPADFTPVEPAMSAEDWTPEIAAAIAESFSQVNCDASNEHFDFLLPDGEPVNPEHIDALIDRFLRDTEPTANDRNKARAHRYEERPEVAERYFQTLEQVGAQIVVFERYFRAVQMVAELAYATMDSPAFRADVDRTAKDFVDLMLLGSISEATVRYGLVPDTAPGEDRYWNRRQQFFDAGGRLD